ncbi:hypothetical protein N0V93_003643 [Gnomoniopsis smithogilvyi]|uniref:C2H2-type domain-containing protein n=1 Tax=Gnomoniopsis smithogilvyi TaxID=1191159 RepID=A0A9W8YX13_9PEZI|nr:hypothetical protein N0V93_003643 [Gnomoniopsis smithogilvyi]
MDDHFNSTWLPVGAVPYHEHLDKRYPSCDEQCIPTGHPHDLSDFSSLFGAQTTTHFDRSHDDACLDKMGCPGLGLDAGMDNHKSRPFSFEPWDRAADSSSFSFATLNAPQVDRSSLGCSMTLSLSDECCNSSCLDEDACSTGTCDPDTFCRDENCPKPQVGHDVAHGATILQEISGAKSNQQLLDPNIHSPGISASTYPYTPQSMEQSTPFPFEYSDPYLADQVNSFGSAPDGQQSHSGARHPSEDFSEGFDPSQGIHSPQGTSLETSAHYTPVPLQHSQAFPSVFHLDSYNSDHTFENSFGQAHTQQTPWNYHPPPVNANFGSPPSNLWTTVQEPLHGFNFNAPVTGQSMGPTCGHHSLNGNNSSRDEVACRPVSQEQPTPSTPILSATATPSPAPELATFVPQEHDIHRCKWILDGERVCGKQFKDNRELHDHIAGTHVEALQADGQDGFICHWAGCSRQTDEKLQSKRGFTARSKLKRHLNIHIGPVDSYICQECGKVCSSSQALNTHLVTHSEARPHRCDEKGCNKAFKTADSLKVHKQNVHSESKPYVCPICGKAFKDSSNFSKHKATHSNEKPWVCRTRGCSESFARRDQLIRHASKMHNEPVKKLNELYPKRVRGARATEQLGRTALVAASSTQMMLCEAI